MTQVHDSPAAELLVERRIAPWRPWLEGLVGLLVAWGAMRLGANPPGLALDALVVVLVAARYGYVLGVGLGLLAAVVSLACAGQGPGSLLRVFMDRSHLALAFAYVAAGAAVGLVGDLPRVATRRLREELARVHENYAQLADRYEVLLDAKEAVDRRIVGQAQTIASLYESARELESLVPQQIPPAMLRLLARFLEVQAASVYLLEGDRLVLAAAQGEASRALALDATHPLHAVAMRREPLAVTREDEIARAGAFLAAPLMHADGRPRGVVAIERLPFRQLTPATRQMLALLADWASRALANSETYQLAQEQQRDHPVTRIHRVAYMNDRLAQEWSAARRYELPLSLVLVHQPALDTAEGSAWEESAAAIAQVLKGRLRTVDVLGHYRTRGSFLLLLPVTPLEGARVLTGRLAEALPECRLAVGSNQEGYADAEALLQALQAVAFEDLKRAG